MKNRKLIILLVLCLLITSLIGCSSKEPSNSASNNVEKNDTVKLVLEHDIATLDPNISASLADKQVFINIYNLLVKLNESGEIVPDLVENWDISPDGKEYKFKLKEGVKFHNGEELKSQDVVFTYEHAKNSPYLEGQIAPVDKVVAINDYEFQINLKYPYAPFLLSSMEIFILNEKAVNDAGDKYGENPIGTGPYKFKKHDIGKQIALERFDDYFEGPAKIKNIEFKVITDLNTSLIALETGEVDFAYSIPMISKDAVKDNAKLALHEYDSIRLVYVVMNTQKEPFNNVLVRQAMNYAINKETVVQVAEEGMGEVPNSIFSKDIFGHSDNVKGYEYNPEKAKQLLTEAGYPNGFNITFKTMDGVYKKAAEIIHQNLRDIGINATIEMGEKNAFIQDLATGNYEVGTIGFSVGMDADFYFITFTSGEMANFSGYANPKVDEMFVKGKEETDNKKRLQIYEDLANLLNEEAVVVPLYYPKGVSVSNSNLKIGQISPEGLIKAYNFEWINK